MGVARLSRRPGRRGRARGQAARARDSLRRAGARRPGRRRRGDALRPALGPRALSARRRRARGDPCARLPSLRLAIALHRRRRTVVRRAFRAGLPAVRRRRHALRLRRGHRHGSGSPGEALGIPPAVRLRRFHESGRVRVVARCAREALRRRRRRGDERWRRAGVPNDAIAFNGDTGQPSAQRLSAALQPMRLRGDARFRRERRCAADRLARAPAGPAASATRSQSGGEPQSDWEGLAASIRGALSCGHERRALPRRSTSAAPTARRRRRSSGCAGCRRACSGRTCACTATTRRRPWDFGAEAEAIAKKWLAFRYRLLPYLQRVIDAATRTGLPVMRAMALAFPGNALVRGCETQFMCGDALLVAPILARGRRSRGRAAAGRMVRPQFTPAFSGLARAALPGGARPVSGLRSRRPCVAARPRGPAHRRDRRAAPARCVVGVRGARRQTLAGFAQVSIAARRRRGDGRRCGAGPRRRMVRRRRARSPDAARPPARAGGRMTGPRAIAITVGEPAGIGPELIAMLAGRHRERPFAARLVVIGDIDLLAARAARAGLCRKLPALRSRGDRARGRRRRSVAPAAGRARDRRASPIPRTRGRCSRCSAAPPMPAPPAPSRRSSPHRCRRAC